MKKVIMVFTDGFEMVEALSVVDILKRGGVEVTMCSATNKLVVTSLHQVQILMNGYLQDMNIRAYDGIILPGGKPNAEHMADNALVRQWITTMNSEKKLVAAICAAPVVLSKCGVLEDKRATCYPTFEKDLNVKELIQDQMVVIDDNIVTSRGMATSLEFGFSLLGILTDQETSQKVRESVIFMY